MTAAGTLACALGIGFVMQSSEISKHRYGAGEGSQPSADTGPVAPELADTTGISVQVENIKLTSALSSIDFQVPSAELAQPKLERVAEVLDTPDKLLDRPRIVEPGCSSIITASPDIGAFVQLSLQATCAQNTRATIRHLGMSFTERTDQDGKLDLLVPAFTTMADFEVTLEHGDELTAHAVVPEATKVRRVVLQYKAGAGFELHAREFGAEYGAEGHVWRGSGNSMEGLKTGSGGHLILLGARDMPDADLAEVYSFPADLSPRNGHIDLSVEARITEANCGKVISAESLEPDHDGAMSSRNISLNVPSCEAEGDYLLLNNLFQDLKIAAR